MGSLNRDTTIHKLNFLYLRLIDHFMLSREESLLIEFSGNGIDII